MNGGPAAPPEAGAAPVSRLAAAAWRLRRRAAEAPRLRASSGGAFLVLGAGAGVSYLAQVATARIVGVDSFGLYAYVLAWVTLLAFLSTLGFHVSLLRLASGYRAEGDWARVRGVIRFATAGAGAAGAALAACGAAAVLWLGGAGAAELSATFLIGLAAAPLFALQLVSAATLRVFGGVVSALAPERLLRDAAALAALAAAVALGLGRPDAPTAMAAMLVSAAATLALVRLLARRARPAELHAAPPRYAVRDWVRPTLPLTAIMAADVVMGRSGVIVLGLLGDARAAGIFAVAFSLATLTALPRMAVAATFAPRIADLHARGDRAGMQRAVARAARLSLLGAACLAAPLLAAAPQLLALFGPEFAAGAPAAAILICGQLVAAAAGPQQHLMTMTGREGAGAAMHVGGAAVGLALCFALAGPFGAVGAAAATACGVVAWNLAMGWFALRRLGLRPGLFAAASDAAADRRKGGPHAR